MLEFLRKESCKTCVKFVRAILAVGLDAIIAFAVVQLAIVLSYVIESELKNASYQGLIDNAHNLITVVAIVAYGGWGIYDGLENVTKSAIPPCSS
jgi:hypothetical protein